MSTTKDELREWFERGIGKGADFMIVACDTYDYDDYPVFCTQEDFEEQHAIHNGVNMQKIMEVYDLSLDMESQMSEHRAFHYPEGFSP